MNLQSAAEIEKERRTRSKLEPHREAIFTLRRRHWTYGQIAKWLNEHGVSVTFSSVHRYCQRAIARRLRAGAPLQTLENIPFSIPQTTTQTKSDQSARANLTKLRQQINLFAQVLDKRNLNITNHAERTDELCRATQVKCNETITRFDAL